MVRDTRVSKFYGSLYSPPGGGGAVEFSLVYTNLKFGVISGPLKISEIVHFQVVLSISM